MLGETISAHETLTLNETIMNNLDIKRRPDSRGWSCVFLYDGQYYLADLTYCFGDVECMIFKSDATGQFTFDDALGEYTNRDCEFSPEALRNCIEDFITNYLSQ